MGSSRDFNTHEPQLPFLCRRSQSEAQISCCEFKKLRLHSWHQTNLTNFSFRTTQQNVKLCDWMFLSEMHYGSHSWFCLGVLTSTGLMSLTFVKEPDIFYHSCSSFVLRIQPETWRAPTVTHFLLSRKNSRIIKYLKDYYYVVLQVFSHFLVKMPPNRLLQFSRMSTLMCFSYQQWWKVTKYNFLSKCT